MSFRVLLVEHDNVVRQLLVSILNTLDITNITEATNGRDGLRQLQASCFNLLVTASIFNHLSGEEMVHEAHKEGWLPPTIFLATTPPGEETRKLIRQYIPKPLNSPSDFMQCVREILSEEEA